MEPLISVIVPVYKVEAYLGRCVESILKQTYQNLEVLLVDDGSPDGCPALCDAFAQRDPRVRVFHKPNGGVASARNLGLEQAAGEYISFIDGDDYIEPEMYADMLDALRHSGADMAVCGFVAEDEQMPRTIDRDTPAAEPVLVQGREMVRRILRGEEDTVCWNRLIRRELADHPFPDIAIGEDAVYLVDLFLKPCTTVILKRAYYHYVQRNGSARISAFSPKHLESLRCAEMVGQKVREACPEFLPELCAFEYEYYIGTLGRIYVWDVERQYPEVIECLEKDIRRVFPRMDTTAVPAVKRLAWYGYRVSKRLFKAVMKRYYRRTLYRTMQE